jgi:hypothetical protein
MPESNSAGVKRKRLSLPKSAMNEGLVAELLGLLGTVTAHGRITEAQINALEA